MFKQPPKPESMKESRLIKSQHTKSGIMCLPGAYGYRTNQDDSNKSPRREQMFVKRNRSLLFEPLKNDERDTSQSRIEHSMRKQQLTSFTLGGGGAENLESQKKRGTSPWKNQSSAVNMCINENLAKRSNFGNEGLSSRAYFT